MSVTHVPPAMVKQREEVRTHLAAAYATAEKLKHSRAIQDHNQIADAEQNMAKCSARVAEDIAAFLDGDTSIEHHWRNICQMHASDGTGALDGELDLVHKLFDQQMQYLSDINKPELFRAFAEAGFPIPRVEELPEAIARTVEYRDKIVERWPLTDDEFKYAFPVDVEDVVTIPPSGYLWSLVAVVWSAFRHPFSTTYIDLSTGESVTLAD